jgi:hypothetical protein
MPGSELQKDDRIRQGEATVRAVIAEAGSHAQF